MAVKAVSYNFKGYKEKTSGFIAHELLEAGILDCVSRNKDELNKDGSPKYQSVDYLKTTVILWKAIQELYKEVEDLKSKLEHLRSKAYVPLVRHRTIALICTVTLPADLLNRSKFKKTFRIPLYYSLASPLSEYPVNCSSAFCLLAERSKPESNFALIFS